MDAVLEGATRRRDMLTSIARLHLGVGAATVPVLVAFRALGTLPSLLPLVSLLLVAMAVIAVIGRRIDVDAAAEAAADRGLAVVAAVDVAVILAAIHLGGGPEAAGLPFFVLPAVAFGGVLPRRSTVAMVATSAAMLAADFIVHQLGWAGFGAPAVSGHAVWSRYFAIVAVTVFAAGVTATLGERWRAEARAARTVARERGHLGELQARIVTTVSHELRTPLSVIQAAAGSLGRYGDRMTAAERSWRLQRIEDSVQATTRLIEDVLPLGEMGDPRDPPPCTELAAVCEVLVADMRPAASANVGLELVVASDAPTTWVHARLARRALRDLLSNAIRFSPEGGRIRVEIAGVPRQPMMVQVRVSDEGIGVPAEDRPFVFEPFYRGSNVTGIPGLGVGLGIARREVELMGGTLVLEARERGASFVVTLPVRRSAAPSTERAAAQA